jgi:hypothetical protein
MDSVLLFGSGFFTWIVLPILIFVARILDVSLGTVRLVFVSRGFKFLAPLVGFFEVLIWILAMGQIMQHLTNPVCYIAYAGGVSDGVVERKGDLLWWARKRTGLAEEKKHFPINCDMVRRVQGASTAFAPGLGPGAGAGETVERKNISPQKGRK